MQHDMKNRSPEDASSDVDDIIRYGTVASVDLAAARCTVKLDDDSITGPLRWMAGRMGATRMWSPPSVGEQVVLLCPGGEIAGAVVQGGLVCNDHPAPADTAIDLIRFSDGAIVKYDPSAHALTIQLPSGATTAITSSGGVSITGDVTVTGKLTASDDVVGGGKSLKNHHHTGVQSGGSQTGGPA